MGDRLSLPVAGSPDGDVLVLTATASKFKQNGWLLKPYVADQGVAKWVLGQPRLAKRQLVLRLEVALCASGLSNGPGSRQRADGEPASPDHWFRIFALHYKHLGFALLPA